MQKIKAASELYIETEKKKREKAYLGNAFSAVGPGSHQVGLESRLVGSSALRAGKMGLEAEDGGGHRGEDGLQGEERRADSRIEESRTVRGRGTALE